MDESRPVLGPSLPARPGTAIPAGDSITVTSADACWEPGSRPVWNNDCDLALPLEESGRVVSGHRYQG